MQLENQIAVRYKLRFTPKGYLIQDKIMTAAAFTELQKRSANDENKTVIVEAWTIGKNGQCISN